VDFVDIAGLVEGAGRGEGLGNKFLHHVRETDALLHVVRCFVDDNVAHVTGDPDPVRDIEIIETELILADIQSLETRLDRLTRQARADRSLAELADAAGGLLAHLNSGGQASGYPEKDTEPLRSLCGEIQFLTSQKVIYCANVDETGMAAETGPVKRVMDLACARDAEVVKLAGKIEADMISLDPDERREFRELYGIGESSLDLTVRTCYTTLGLVSFFTTNANEVRAWTVRQGCKAPRAAGEVHTDFERGFVRAQVIPCEEYLAHGGEAACRAAGVMRTEGKDYVVRDGDVIFFLFNT
jgi:GTP-binding protein YchF